MKKYISERGAGEITPAQYIMEQFLILLAKQSGSALPSYFWKQDKYKTLWKRHIRSVHKLLKEYEPDIIVAALRDKKLEKLKSLSNSAAWLWKPVFEKYKKRKEKNKNEVIADLLVFDRIISQEDIDKLSDEIDYYSIRISNNTNKIQKLKDLDNPKDSNKK